MDLERAFKFPFDDEEWLQKLLIGGVLNVIPIANLATLGYGLRALKNVTEGEDTPLPTWSEFGDHFVKGLLAFLAVVIYWLPMQVVLCVGGLLDSAIAGGYDSGPGIFGICFGILGFVYGILMSIVLVAALTKFAREGEFAAFFRFGEILRYITANLGNLILAWIVAVLVYIAASIVGGLVCGIGLLLTMPWAMLAAAHLFGQVYRESQKVVA